MARIQALRGMNDILPEQSPLWRFLETRVEGVLDQYGYREIRLPVVEKTELFRRSIGEVTDIVEKEMYTFEDRNGESLTLRPEGTAGCVRAGEEHGLLYNQIQRLWYRGPMFRYEKPQKGRYRQFHQMGVEAFGMAAPEADAEVILLSARLWRALGLGTSVRLELNSLGTPEAREAYRRALVDYLEPRRDSLDPDSRRRLNSNPLRILDSKETATQALLAEAPRLADFIDAESQRHFETLKALLDDAGLEYRVNPRLVRGLDYYSKTVFEWVTDALGAQGTVCAGGRYDGLVQQLGGRPSPAVGFALGVERLVLLLDTLNCFPEHLRVPLDVFLAAEHKGIQSRVMAVAEQLRDALPGLRVGTHLGGLKNINNKARQSGSRWNLLLSKDQDRLVARLWQGDDLLGVFSLEEAIERLKQSIA